MLNQVRADRQVVQIAVEEGPYTVIGGADDRLFVHVEAGVDDRGESRPFAKRLDDAVEARVPVTADGMGSGRPARRCAGERGGGAGSSMPFSLLWQSVEEVWHGW